MAEETNQSNPNEPQFMIQRIYIKDASFEAPSIPDVFKLEWQPKLDLDLSSRSKRLEDNVYEVELSVTATVNNADKVAFISEVKQAGIFTVEGAPEDQLGHLLGSFCPNILFPYAREVVSDMVMKASFPQLVLAPVNFDALYMQQLEQQKKTTN